MTDRRARSRFDKRLTVATGYVATGPLGLTLLIGPANLLLRRRNPISSYLRRDVGMWTAGFSKAASVSRSQRAPRRDGRGERPQDQEVVHRRSDSDE